MKHAMKLFKNADDETHSKFGLQTDDADGDIVWKDLEPFVRTNWTILCHT
jgi:hypothetical protein